MTMRVKIKKVHKDAIIPSYAKPGDAGMDLTAVSSEIMQGKNRRKIVYGTGLAMEIPEGHVGLLFPRSSVHKTNLRLSNCVGVIDSGYRGEVSLIFEEDQLDMDRISYDIGDRVGQIIIMPYPEVTFEEVEEISTTERGEGGFGSTGN